MRKHLEEHRRLEALIDQLNPNGEPQIRWVYRAPEQIEDSGRKLGIFSASFNPFTVAHVKMIEEAQKQFHLDEVVLILAKANVDKSVFGLSLADRLLMLKHYACGRTDFSVAACSHGRFVEKIHALKPSYPPDTHFSFVVGYDTLIRIFDPKYYTDLHRELETLFRQCQFIVANRQDNDAEDVEHFLSQPDHRRYADRIDLIELSGFYAEISSTDIRDRIKKGNSVDHLVPPEVQALLNDVQAYRA